MNQTRKIMAFRVTGELRPAIENLPIFNMFCDHLHECFLAKNAMLHKNPLKNVLCIYPVHSLPTS